MRKRTFLRSIAMGGGLGALARAEAPAPVRVAALRQRMVLLKSAGTRAGEFFEFVQTPAARTVLRRYGFSFE